LSHKEAHNLKQITVRGVPDEIGRKIKKEADRKGLSLNKAFISLLEKAAGTKSRGKKRKDLCHDLDHLSGIWAKDEAETFKKSLDFQRRIDEDLWKKTK
jgi:hypothetical protein